jgi:hypothetical protein
LDGKTSQVPSSKLKKINQIKKKTGTSKRIDTAKLKLFNNACLTTGVRPHTSSTSWSGQPVESLANVKFSDDKREISRRGEINEHDPVKTSNPDSVGVFCDI